MRPLAAALVVGLAACSEAEPSAATRPGRPDPQHLELCVPCHGRDGRARLPGYPHIAGQDAGYQFEQLRRFRSGQRAHPAMRAVVGLLREEDMRALSDYYAGQGPCPPERR